MTLVWFNKAFIPIFSFLGSQKWLKYTCTGGVGGWTVYTVIIGLVSVQTGRNWNRAWLYPNIKYNPKMKMIPKMKTIQNIITTRKMKMNEEKRMFLKIKTTHKKR